VGADGANSLVARMLFPGRRGRVLGALEGEVLLNGATSSLGAGAIVLDLGVVAGGYGWVSRKRGASRSALPGCRGDTTIRGQHIKNSCGRSPPRRARRSEGLGHPIPLYGGKAAERLSLTTPGRCWSAMPLTSWIRCWERGSTTPC